MRPTTALAICGWAIFLTMACTAIGLRVDLSTPTPSPSPAAVDADVEVGDLVRADVVQVIDGSTIDVSVDGALVRVRYLGISVPDDRSDAAAEFNAFLVGGRTVELEADLIDTDSAGSLLRYVYVQGEMVNLALLTNGYAKLMETLPELKHETALVAAQQSARTDRRGIWQSSDEPHPSSPSDIGSGPEQEFAGGTLPRPPESEKGPLCDYSGTDQPVIKGNVDGRTGDRLYHVPGGFYYETTEVDESIGDRWICTEEKALAAGWKRSKR